MITTPEYEHFSKYKIGETSNPSKKDLLRRYHTALPECKILEFEPVYDSRLVEGEIHKELSKYRTAGEWFTGDFLLFKNVFMCQVYKNRTRDTLTEDQLYCNMFDWFVTYFDPTKTSTLLSVNGSLELNASITCPVSKLYHEKSNYVLTMDVNGNVVCECDSCGLDLIGNCGHKSVLFTKTNEFIDIDDKLVDGSKKIQVFLGVEIEPKIGFMNVKVGNDIILADNQYNFYKNNIHMFNLNDSQQVFTMKKKWFETMGIYGSMLDFSHHDDDTLIFTNKAEKCIFADNKCSTFYYKNNILSCSCSKVALEEDILTSEVEKFLKQKGYTFSLLKKDANSFQLLNFKCPTHESCQNSILTVDQNGYVNLNCQASGIKSFTFNKLGQLPVIYDSCWKNLIKEYISTTRSPRYIDFLYWYKKKTKKCTPTLVLFNSQLSSIQHG